MRIDDNSIRIDRHKCIACGICVDRCIMDNLRLSVAPCRQACPLNMNCQGYVRLIAAGREEKALEDLRQFGPLLSLIAETCNAPCENACARRKKDGAVHILELKRYLVKKYSKELYHIQSPDVWTQKRVAIIGAGVSGLASGLKAIQYGHMVSIFERPSDKENQDYSIKKITTSLQNSGAVFCNEIFNRKKRLNVNSFDAVILSQPEDISLIEGGLLKENDCLEINSLTHFIEDNIFCCNTLSSGERKPVFQISNAFETVESVNRYLSGEPLDWGRGFYTQGGAVKSYAIDQRVGKSFERALKEDLLEGLDEAGAKEQASRCFSCGRAFEKNQTC